MLSMAIWISICTAFWFLCGINYRYVICYYFSNLILIISCRSALAIWHRSNVMKRSSIISFETLLVALCFYKSHHLILNSYLQNSERHSLYSTRMVMGIFLQKNWESSCVLLDRIPQRLSSRTWLMKLTLMVCNLETSIPCQLKLKNMLLMPILYFN